MSQQDIMYMLGLLALFPVIIAIPVLIQVMLFSNKSLKMNAEHKTFDDEETIAWVNSHGFVWVGEYTLSALQNARIIAWQLPGKMSYFCLYLVAGRVVVDFVTCFVNDFSLTTGTTRDGLLLPSIPHKYHQCFENLSLDEQFAQHVAAEKFIMDKAKVAVADAREPFAQVFVTAIQRQMAYIRSLFLWPLHGCWWYFVRRNRLVNKTIEEQVERRLVAAPDEIM